MIKLILKAIAQAIKNEESVNLTHTCKCGHDLDDHKQAIEENNNKAVQSWKNNTLKQ